MRSLAILMALCGACSTATKANLIESSISDYRRRQELFEATLEVLDRNPEYVDEFFQLTLRHHATLERFVVNETRALKDPKLARLVSMYLRDEPRAFEEIMEQSFEHSANRPAAQRALAAALRKALHDPEKRKTLEKTLKEALEGE
jgi:hypothetical protein